MHTRFQEMLEKAGYDFFHQIGFWNGNAELSLLITHISKEVAHAYASYLNQEAFIFGQKVNGLWTYSLIYSCGITTELSVIVTDQIAQNHSVLFMGDREVKYQFL